MPGTTVLNFRTALNCFLCCFSNTFYPLQKKNSFWSFTQSNWLTGKFEVSFVVQHFRQNNYPFIPWQETEIHNSPASHAAATPFTLWLSFRAPTRLAHELLVASVNTNLCKFT